MLGRDHRALDDHDVQPGLQSDLVVLAHSLRRQGRGADDALLLDLLDPLRDQLGLDRLAVDPLHLGRRVLGRQPGDALELGVGVLVAGEDAFQVQNGQPAELPDDPGRARRHNPVHRGGEQWQLESVGPERPADIDVVRVARAPGGHYRDVIEAVCAAALLATTDLYFHGYTLGSATDGEPA